MYRAGDVDFSECVFFNPDEYYWGLAQRPPGAHDRFMKENFFEYIRVREDQINIPDGSLSDEEAIRTFCQEYEAKIRGLGGIYLQSLSSGPQRAHWLQRTNRLPGFQDAACRAPDITRKDAAPDFFGLRNVPTKAITMGVGFDPRSSRDYHAGLR